MVQVSVGQHHVCALNDSGAVECWGSNYVGQLGDGSTTDSATPVMVRGLASGVAAISVKADTSCALMTSGEVKCWGSNSFNILGLGLAVSYSTVPVSIDGFGEPIAAISVGQTHACALTLDHGLVCAGETTRMGELGNGARSESEPPVDVVGLQAGVSAVSAGGEFTCALTTVGGVKCWGDDGTGEVGDGIDLGTVVVNDPANDRLSPTDVIGLTSGVTAITTTSLAAYAVTAGGTVKTWGENVQNSLYPTSAPVDVVGTQGTAVAISGGFNDACTTTAEGILDCWGHLNGVGDGYSIPSSNTPAPVPLP